MALSGHRLVRRTCPLMTQSGHALELTSLRYVIPHSPLGRKVLGFKIARRRGPHGGTHQRREFITLLGGAAVSWPLAAHAQQQDRTRRVGILMPYPPSDREIQNRVQAFKEELRNRGWTAGVNVQFDERWTMDNMDLIRAAAANLVELKPDVVVAVGGRVIPILMKMTSSIPIIVPGGASPVERAG